MVHQTNNKVMNFFWQKPIDDYNFFKLLDEENAESFESEGEFSKHLRTSSYIRNCSYIPNKWPETCKDDKKIENITFENVSFSKTDLENIEFKKCKFIRCLFIGTTFSGIQFHKTTFKNCNFFRAKISNCYWEPNTVNFDKYHHKKFANICTSTYQTLMKNANEQDQSDHEKDADINFRYSKRHQLKFDYKEKKFNFFQYAWKILSSMLYQYLCGFGYKPLRFSCWTIVFFIMISVFNMYFFKNCISVSGDPVIEMNIADSIYYSFSMLTGLGFSDVIPTTPFSKIITVIETFLGIIWMGLFVSIVTKRILI